MWRRCRPIEAADALSELDDETTAEILEEMETEPVDEVKELLEYDEDTAGGMMNTEAIVLPEETTLADAMVQLREHEDLLENTHVLFLPMRRPRDRDGAAGAAVPGRRRDAAERIWPLSA